MNNDQLLYEVEELLQNCPPLAAFKEQDNEVALRWLGHTSTVLSQWDPIESIEVASHTSALQSSPNNALENSPASTRTSVTTVNQLFDRSGPALRGLRALLYQAQRDLRTRTGGALSTPIESGRTFDYFDEIRKIIKSAQKDLLFIDPYLDADFVSRYFPQITKRVTVRLLTSKKLPALLPAVEIFVTQHGLKTQVRSVGDVLHDRLIFVDKQLCFLSGTSFKDGTRRSATTLIQVTDAFEEIYQMYQQMWSNSRVVFGAGIG